MRLQDVPRDYVGLLHVEERSKLFELPASCARLQQEPREFAALELGEPRCDQLCALSAKSSEHALHFCLKFSPVLLTQEEHAPVCCPRQRIILHVAVLVARQPVWRHEARKSLVR